jgi:hypothetical protein
MKQHGVTLPTGTPMAGVIDRHADGRRDRATVWWAIRVER